jgi:hypothetical protein
MRSRVAGCLGVLIIVIAALTGCRATEPPATPSSDDVALDLGSSLEVKGGATGIAWIAPSWLVVGHRDGGPAAFTSPNGREWAELDVEQGQEGTMTLAGVAGSSEGTIAVGSVVTDDGPRAITWTLNGTPAPTALLRDDGVPRYLYAVASQGDVVIAGGMRPFGTNGETTGELWRLRDGSARQVRDQVRQ